MNVQGLTIIIYFAVWHDDYIEINLQHTRRVIFYWVSHKVKLMGNLRESVVQVNEGKLLGSTKTNINGEDFYTFQGVPYAKPPLGCLRFKVSFL